MTWNRWSGQGFRVVADRWVRSRYSLVIDGLDEDLRRRGSMIVEIRGSGHGLDKSYELSLIDDSRRVRWLDVDGMDEAKRRR